MNNLNEKHGSGKIIFILSAMILLAIIPSVSWAAPSFFTVPEGDLSIKLLLSKFFAGAMPGDAGSGAAVGNDPFVGMLKILNGAALTIGGILAAYTLVAGTMQTAHDGEMLGKRWSSMWLPIRTAIGIGMVVPVGQGYCVAQLIVMWLAVQGVGLADKVWEAFLDTGLQQFVAYSVAQSPKVTSFAHDALKLQVCMASLKYEVESHNLDLAKGVKVGPAKIDVAKQNITDYGYTQPGKYFGVGGNQKACGRITQELDNATLDAQPVASAPNAMGDTIGLITDAVSAGFDPNLASPIIKAHDTQTQALLAALAPIASKLIDPKNAASADPAEYDKAVEKYRTEVVKAALGVDYKAQLQAVIDNAKKNGWIMAGSWFARIAALVNEVNKAVNSVPDVQLNPDMNADMAGIVASNAMSSNFKAAENYYSKTKTGIAEGGLMAIGLDQAVSGQDVTQKESSSLMKGLLKAFGTLDVSDLKKDTRHPLVTAQEVGVRMLKWTAGGIVAVTLGSMTMMGAMIGPLIGLVLFSGIAAATIMAIYTPMMPFITYLVAAFGWVLLVVEAMVAAPLWAVMHLSPAGDDLMGSAKQGYSLLLSLMLRPALIVIGFCCATIVAYPFGMFLNAVFFQSFLMATNNGESFYSFILLAAGTVVYASFLLVILHKSFSLIHKIPDELLKWFGGGGASLGQAAQEASQGVKAGVAALGGAVAQAPGQTSQGIQQARMLGNQKQQSKISSNNAADSAGASASKEAGESAIQSQKANTSGKSGDHLEAYQQAKQSEGASGMAANAASRAGRRSEAGSHMQEKEAARDSAQGHGDAIKSNTAESGAEWDAISKTDAPAGEKADKALAYASDLQALSAIQTDPTARGEMAQGSQSLRLAAAGLQRQDAAEKVAAATAPPPPPPPASSDSSPEKLSSFGPKGESSTPFPTLNSGPSSTNLPAGSASTSKKPDDA